MARAGKRWLDHLQDDRGFSPYTIKTYRSALTVFVNLLPAVYSDRDLLDAMNIRMGHSASGHVAYTTYTALMQFFQWWEQYGGIENPLAQRQPIPKPTSRRHGMSKEEQHALSIRLLQASLKERAVAWLMLTEGFRVGDVANVKVEHVDFGAGLIRAAQGKRRSDAWLPLCEPARDSLRAWLTWTGITAGWVFPGSTGQMHRQTVWKIWKRVCGDELKHLKPHQARHTYGTLLVRGANRTDLQTAKVLLRHKNIAQTEIYVDDDEEEQRGAIINLGNYFRGLTERPAER
jgi:site-specific recombinase XerD